MIYFCTTNFEYSNGMFLDRVGCYVAGKIDMDVTI
jgi:hypothetical protein